jgi:hypothetical protein
MVYVRRTHRLRCCSMRPRGLLIVSNLMKWTNSRTNSNTLANTCQDRGVAGDTGLQHKNHDAGINGADQ